MTKVKKPAILVAAALLASACSSSPSPSQEEISRQVEEILATLDTSESIVFESEEYNVEVDIPQVEVTRVPEETVEPVETTAYKFPDKPTPSPIEDFVIEDGVLVEYKGKGGDIVLPNSVEKFEGNAFWGAGNYENTTITSIVLPDDIKEFNLFNLNALKYLYIPEYISEFDGRDLSGNSLVGICVNKENDTYYDIDGVLFRKNGDEATLVKYPQGKLEWEYTIPDNVTSLGYDAFDSCTHLKQINIPGSVTSFGEGTFSGCTALKSLDISANVKYDVYHWSRMFDGCLSLTAFNVSEDNEYLTDIDGVLFTKDKSVLVRFPSAKSNEYEIPAGTSVIGPYAFYWDVYLENITIPDTVTGIKKGSLNGTNLKGLTIPDSVTEIEYDAVSLFGSYHPDFVATYKGKQYTQNDLYDLTTAF